MDVSIKIKETTEGNFKVIETVDSYAESVEEQFTNDSVLYSESVSVTLLLAAEDEGYAIMNYVINNHDEDNVVTTLEIRDDGPYKVIQLVIPTMDWLQQAITAGYLDKFSDVFVVYNESIYKYLDDELVLVDINDVLSAEYSNIWKAEEFAFSIFNLWQCYLNRCKSIGDSVRCMDCDSEILRDADLLWIVLNTIQYLVEVGEYDRANETLKLITGCNGLCNNEPYSKNYNCGCNS